MAQALANKLARIADLIRQGDILAAQADFLALKRTKIPRAQTAQAATLARKANLPAISVRLLNPIVRPSRRIPVEATALEKAEYAAALTGIGASEEALSLLKTIDATLLPQVLLFRAYAYMAHWRYAESIPLLDQYVKTDSIEAYERVIGKVNLTAALIFERRHKEATELLEGLTRETDRLDLPRVLGYVLELSAQNSLFQGKWDEAQVWLKNAEHALRRDAGLPEFFVRKWKAILDFLKGGASNSGLKLLREIRAEAEKREHWETVRTCDRFEAVGKKDEALYAKLYFGTPFASFRAKLKGEFQAVPPDNFIWQLGEGRSAWAIDLLSGRISPGKSSLKTGQLLHKLLIILASDFYRPFRLAAIHDLLFPGDYYNPQSSRTRVHYNIGALRNFFTTHHVPLTIREEKGLYRLVATGGRVEIHITREEPLGDRQSLHLRKLRETWPRQNFSLKDASVFLGIPSRSTHRILEQAQKEGVIVRQNRGAATRYRFAA